MSDVPILASTCLPAPIESSSCVPRTWVRTGRRWASANRAGAGSVKLGRPAPRRMGATSTCSRSRQRAHGPPEGFRDRLPGLGGPRFMTRLHTGSISHVCHLLSRPPGRHDI